MELQSMAEEQEVTSASIQVAKESLKKQMEEAQVIEEALSVKHEIVIDELEQVEEEIQKGVRSLESVIKKGFTPPIIGRAAGTIVRGVGDLLKSVVERRRNQVNSFYSKMRDTLKTTIQKAEEVFKEEGQKNNEQDTGNRPIGMRRRMKRLMKMIRGK